MPVLPKTFRTDGFARKRGAKLLPATLAVIVLVLGPLALVAYACGGGGGGGERPQWGGGWHGRPSAPATPSAPSTPTTPPSTPPSTDNSGGSGVPGGSGGSPGSGGSGGSGGNGGPGSHGSDPTTDGTNGGSNGNSGNSGSGGTGGPSTGPRGGVVDEKPSRPRSSRGEIDDAPSKEDKSDSVGGTVSSGVAGIASSVAQPAVASIRPAVSAVSGDEEKSKSSSSSNSKEPAPARNAEQLRERTTIARAVDGIPLIFRAALLLLVFATSVLAVVSLRERRRATSVARVAQLDHLTGLANREGFDRQMAIEWERAMRHGRPLGLVFVDLDNFKEFNDTHGHVAGDRLLREVAAAITATSRASDYTARLGGDEFVVICPDADADGLERLVDRLRVEAAGMAVTLSVGAASKLDSDETSDALVHRADIAMYRAKGGRRRTVSSANPMLGSLRRP